MLKSPIERVTTRIALDLPELRLANPLFNRAADVKSVSFYAQNLNQFLTDSGLHVRLASIQGIRFGVTGYKELREVELNTSRKDIEVSLAIMPIPMQWRVLLIPLLFAGLFSALVLYNVKVSRELRAQNKIKERDTKAKLVIDLRDRSLYLNISPDTKATLSNKPICFYLAMLRYCRDNDKAVLYHNKNLPEEFIELANKYFYRLLELGHSRRKRPDFDSNIDKMLSEIRAALDEVLDAETDLKKVFYPQKAQGEGSRSKLHNYALSGLNSEHYELIGH